MARMRFTINSFIPLTCLFLFWMSHAFANDGMVDHSLMGDVARISNWGAGNSGRTSCPRADTSISTTNYSEAVNRISGALGMADQMPGGKGQDSPERVSINQFCDNVQTRFPNDAWLPKYCVLYRGSLSLRSANAASTRDQARELLFSEINRRPEASKALVSYATKALDQQYYRCMKAQGVMASSLGENKATSGTTSVATSWQENSGKKIESQVRYGNGNASETTGAFGKPR